MTPDGELMAMAVRTEPTFAHDSPKILFRGNYVDLVGARAFDLSPDGKRFLMILKGGDDIGASEKIVLVQNWLAELKRLVPTDN